MTRDEFESTLLTLWVKSQVPINRGNLCYLSKEPRKKVDRWLKELVAEGVLDLEMDSRNPSLREYSVTGVVRPGLGPRDCAEYEKKRELIEEAKQRILAKRAGTASEDEMEDEKPPRDRRSKEASSDEDDGPGLVSLMGKVAVGATGKALVALDKPLSVLDKPTAKGEKNLWLSGGLSLFGPIGWLYAGSFREAIPASIGYIAVGSILPSFILAPFMFVGMIASGVVGMTYAWQYNRKKGRTPLFLKSPKKKKKKD